MWDKIKGAIFTEDPNAPKVEIKEDPLAKHVQAPPQNTRLVPYANGGQPPAVGRGGVYGTAPPVPSSVMPYTPQPQVNEAMVAAIRKATFSRNTALTGLIQAADSLADVIPDPVMRLKAAQRTAGGGRPAKEMADAVTIHLNDVEGEEMKFAQAMKAQHDKEVTGLVQKAERAEESAKRAQAEAESLQQRIQDLQNQSSAQYQEAVGYRNEAVAADNQLKQAEAEFKLAAEAVRNELNAHRNTILSTLT